MVDFMVLKLCKEKPLMLGVALQDYEKSLTVVLEVLKKEHLCSCFCNEQSLHLFSKRYKTHHWDDALLQFFLKQSFYPADILVPYASLPHFFFARCENTGSSCSVVRRDLNAAGDYKGKHCLMSTKGHSGCQHLPSP